MPISSLEPKLVWRYFEKLMGIPRPSHHEEAVQKFILEEAERLGLQAERDVVGNILIKKPAADGYEDHKGVILQGHLDMVAQKNNDTVHDFEKDPISAYIDDGWVTAKGTTLGADNGIGVASALAVLASDDIKHGPLEVLFTASEETGMIGAKGLKPNWLSGECLLNLDSETLGEICIGCAGGIDASFELPIAYRANSYNNTFNVRLKGLKGGHSGADIDKQRGNAIMLLSLALSKATQILPLQISEINGGNLRNAIPREAEVEVSTDEDLLEVKNLFDCISSEIKQGLNPEDQNIAFDIKIADKAVQTWDQATQNTVLQTLSVFPNGVNRMSVDQKGVVETSVNLAQINSEKHQLKIHALIRSLRDIARDDLALNLVALFSLAGGKSEFDNPYSGWQPNPNNPLNDIVAAEAEKVLGHVAKLMVIHAGLECGLMSEQYPNWQMVSFGPNIEMPHSPDERVEIKSVSVFWDWLVAVLARI